MTILGGEFDINFSGIAMPYILCIHKYGIVRAFEPANRRQTLLSSNGRLDNSKLGGFFDKLGFRFENGPPGTRAIS